jgi:hypothetical protein
MRLNSTLLCCTQQRRSTLLVPTHHTIKAYAQMKSILATTLAILAASANADVLFLLSSEPNGQGIQKSWVVPRWKCTDLSVDGLDNQASWAFVAGGLANGCELYE